jgi:hypothetical protein
MKKKIANYLKYILLKRKKKLAEQFLLKVFFLFYPKKFERFKESLGELLSKRRIAIISPSDSELNLYSRLQWGDYWVKYELTKAFGEMGYIVTDIEPDIVIHLFGTPARLPKRAYRIIWVYSHPDMVNAKLLRQYNKIFCLSSFFAQKIRQMGFDAEFMIGATANKPAKREIKYDVVFVGNTRLMPGGRKIVRDIGETPYNFKVWGKGWENILPEKYYGGRYIDYTRLNELYSSSLITLNDHHKDMSREGFVAVRIFDILASGGFCISDKNSGIEEIFGDAVPQYESPKHLKDLIDFYVNHPDERIKLMEKGRGIALQYIWKKKAKKFLDGIEKSKLGGRK